MPSTVDERAASAVGEAGVSDEAGVSSASPDVQGDDAEISTDHASISNNVDAQAHTPSAPAENPIAKYGRPWSVTVPYDVLHEYDQADLTATKMYHRPQVNPIALVYMGIGVPGFPDDLSSDHIISKIFKVNRGQLFSKSQVLPTNNTNGKKYLMKELIRRHVLDVVDGVDITMLPKCKHHKIGTLIELLKTSPPPPREHCFILQMLDALRAEVATHYSGHSGTREASLNRNMRYVEVIMHPDLARDWKERNMSKNRIVRDAECSHSEQCETNDHLISVWTKASLMFNDPNITLYSRVFADCGPPFNRVITLHPVGEEHHMQPETFQKKYTSLAVGRWTRYKASSMQVVREKDLMQVVLLRILSVRMQISTHIWLFKMPE